MNLCITAPMKGGCIEAIPSKSQAHRLLICAALADGPTRILCPATSEDIDATAGCLRALGATITYDGTAFSVKPITQVKKGQTLFCRESGSTLRFLLPVAAALGADCRFLLEGRLPQRPQGPLLSVLAAHSCTSATPTLDSIELQGKLQSGNFEVPGGVSSQFVSGLLMALPLLENASRIIVDGSLQSRPYVDMTLQVLRAFNASVREQDNVFYIPGAVALHTLGEATVEGDWSNAAFWLCAGAIGLQPMRCKGLNLSSIQGDKAIVSLLRRLGAHVDENGGEVTAMRATLRGGEIDAADVPDLVPVLAAVAALAEGTTRIYNAERLRLKESDRLQAVTQALTALGADVAEQSDGLLITGRPTLMGGTIDSCGDHRIAMMAAVAAIGCSGPVTVRGAQAVHKSYPAFWQHYALLGGKVEEC